MTPPPPPDRSRRPTPPPGPPPAHRLLEGADLRRPSPEYLEGGSRPPTSRGERTVAVVGSHEVHDDGGATRSATTLSDVGPCA
eukprot:15433958-Alexandrium_andersonii.AAC.1